MQLLIEHPVSKCHVTMSIIMSQPKLSQIPHNFKACACPLAISSFIQFRLYGKRVFPESKADLNVPFASSDSKWYKSVYVHDAQAAYSRQNLIFSSILSLIFSPTFHFDILPFFRLLVTKTGEWIRTLILGKSRLGTETLTRDPLQRSYLIGLKWQTQTSFRRLKCCSCLLFALRREI